jgi:hypothetical protein
MNQDELFSLISDTAADTINANLDYIEKQHRKEMESFLSENKDPDYHTYISRLLQVYLRTAIELSTSNTLSVLKSLGLDVTSPEE